MLPILTWCFPSSSTSTTITTMHPIFLFLFLFLYQFLLSHAQLRFDYPTEKINTTWVNNPSFTRNSIYFITGTKIRLLLLNSGGGGGPSFACGFLCAPPCHGFIFSIFVVNTTVEAELPDDSNAAPSLWSPNSDRLVGENATLHFTKDGDLILLDADGTFVWSTNTSNHSVSFMNLTSSGNLILLNNKNEAVWSSFDHPTDTVLNGQTLKLGQSLTSNSSATNTTRCKFYLSLQKHGFYAFVNSSPPQLYAELLNKPRKIANTTYLTFKDGRLVWPNDSLTLISNPGNWAVQFIRLEFDGHLRVYGIGQNFIPGVTILSDFTNFQLGYCDYPMACGEFGICSNGQCSCPVNVSDGDPSFFKLNSWGLVNRGCSPVNPISCQSAKSHRLLPLGSISYFNYVDENAVALRGTDEESCKQACLMNCSCKGAFFKYGRDFSQGDCYLPSEVFSLKNTSSMTYNSSAYIKIQIAPASNQTSFHPVAESSISKESNRINVLAAMLGSLVFTSVVAWVIILRCRRRRVEDMEDGDQFDQVRGVLVRFSFEELYLATQGFKRKLGEGGFGSVFWGTLNNGNKVAVKKLEGLGQGKKEFLAEVETIGSIHHINLVELIGFCAEKSHRLLVYEYMPNGSLDQWIFGREEEEEEVFLDWQTRRNIILDIAKGLCYLHEECRHRIAHLDIKPQNILLDEKFNAKVADFGMSKLIDRDQREVMTRMRGTPGYLAPEWLTSIITEKVDVYSFGVVVLEIICGRKNLDPSQPEEAVQLIALLETFKIHSSPDAFLNNNRSIWSDDEDAIKLLGLAMWCLQSDSKRRPAMSMVVKVLEGLEEVESNIDYDFFGTHQNFADE
ncbi:G-type lectin S-receptor-like serine/threonine-protein kinase SD2-5 [Dendrobium catenatum]|uniref:Receptor-like serine/threonine-protein kinase n=1 Tax=Dendrobium catenatum TaxID=906689 RepID=A0A2I0WAG8_9ASPA|nr:G-type lectin S-receptor-like serine/threonine-protein kinase SD2-5 [Dendrobium catenatum]PKU72651.1 G-type lectin S-receptor-like serine/threonine-protein kinase SD2-5 [Dendrobium catenatum]